MAFFPYKNGPEHSSADGNLGASEAGERVALTGLLHCLGGIIADPVFIPLLCTFRS